MTHLFYPRRNVIGIAPEWHIRRLQFIERIDLVKHPLPIRDFLRRPLTRRGRWLIRAYDHDACQYRKFYECGFKHCFREPPLRIGRRIDDGSIVPISPDFPATVLDRKLLAMTLHRLKQLDQVFVYADDLALIRVSA